jgi:hypothetical protein
MSLDDLQYTRTYILYDVSPDASRAEHCMGWRESLH